MISADHIAMPQSSTRPYRGLVGSIVAGSREIGDPFERTIRQALRQLSRQRVRMILQPGNVRVIDNAVQRNQDTDAALMTCWLRGWAEPVENAVPTGQLTPDGQLPNPVVTGVMTMYRLTDSGWSVVHRSHMWLLITVIIAFLSLCLGILVSGLLSHPH